MVFSSVYLDFLLYFFVIPIIVTGIWVWREWFRAKKTLFAVLGCTFVFGPLCDMVAIRTDLWRYDTGRPHLGIWISDLPLEEFLFYLLFPLLIFGVWHAVRRFSLLARLLMWGE